MKWSGESSLNKAPHKETKEALPTALLARGDNVRFEGKKYKVAAVLSPEKRGVPTVVLAPEDAPEDYEAAFDYGAYEGVYREGGDDEMTDEEYAERYGKYVEADFGEVERIFDA